MLNELSRQLKAMTAPGDTVICAVSGGADSMALLFGVYLLRDGLRIHLEAAHFNHGLRGRESDEDEVFVAEFCQRFGIVLHRGAGQVIPGKKGLEAAAREARYGFFAALQGKIATAHTADDNTETVLMHLIRGTGLKGLGGITPVRGNVIRPMLGVTRQQVLAFLEEYHIPYRTDSTNREDDFLRNRLRHHVMPILLEENPALVRNVSAMAGRLRQDEEALAALADYTQLPKVSALREMSSAVRSRMLERFLRESGVSEPEAEHIALAEKLVFSDKPSARGFFPNDVCIGRNYDTLQVVYQQSLPTVELPLEGELELPMLGVRVICGAADGIVNTDRVFTVCPRGRLWLRCRQSGDTMRLPGGSKSLKKLFTDRKIPAHQRQMVPILVDDDGVVAVYNVGVNLDRAASVLPAMQIRFEKMKEINEEDQQWKE